MTEKSKKEQKRISKIIIGCVIAVIIIGIIIIVYQEQKSSTERAIRELEGQLAEQGQLSEEQEEQLEELAKVTCKDIEVPYEAQEEYTEQEPYSVEDCETKDLVYNIENFRRDYLTCLQTEQRCLKYILGICVQKETYCIKKKISCSLLVNNLDNIRGYWTFDFKFYDIEDMETPVETNVRAFSIYPQSSQDFQASTQFLGEEKAEKSYTCRYQLTNIPTKQECETLTKYKTVIKYRTITKYRTETICD